MKVRLGDFEIDGEVIGHSCQPVYSEDGKTLLYSKYETLVRPKSKDDGDSPPIVEPPKDRE